MVLTQWETLCGLFFAFFEKIVVPILTSGGLAAVTSSFFAALYSAFGKYDVVHIHAEGPAFFSWLPKMFGKRVVVTIHGIDWQREKWQSGLGSKFIQNCRSAQRSSWSIRTSCCKSQSHSGAYFSCTWRKHYERLEATNQTCLQSVVAVQYEPTFFLWNRSSQMLFRRKSCRKKRL